MKIDIYEVPVTLKRTSRGVEVILHEDKKAFLRSESVSGDINMVPNIAKQLSDENDVQRTLIGNTMLRNETESTGKITLKYLS